MSDSKHSEEPWKHQPYSGSPPEFRMFGITDANGNEFICAVGGKDEAQCLANIERIVACINLCAGIPTEELVPYSEPQWKHTPVTSAIDMLAGFYATGGLDNYPENAQVVMRLHCDLSTGTFYGRRLDRDRSWNVEAAKWILQKNGFDISRLEPPKP